MAKFTFKRYYKCSNGEIDDENVWVKADNKLNAFIRVQEEYPHSTDFVLLKSK